MKERLLKNTYFFSLGFFTVAMCAVVFFSYNKTIEISDIAQDEVKKIGKTTSVILSNTEVDEDVIPELRDFLIFSQEETNVDYLSIPLPPKTPSESIIIENHYMDSMLYIDLANVDSEFYKIHALSGSRAHIVEGTFESVDLSSLQSEKTPVGMAGNVGVSASLNGTRLCFSMNGTYEYKTILENDVLYVSFLNPREIYQKIIVVDPISDTDDKGISLAVTKKLKELLDDTDIKTYYTRMDEDAPSQEKRLNLANGTRADMLVRIGVDRSEDASIYGITGEYNGDYFIPGYGNVELADDLVYQLTTSVQGRAVGLKKVGASDYMLKNATVPTANIRVGFITNEQEGMLLLRDEYVERIAQGIFNGIMTAYEKKP